MRKLLFLHVLMLSLAPPVLAAEYKPTQTELAVAAVLVVDRVKGFMSKPEHVAKTIRAEWVTADKVATDYNANEVAADRQYFGKKVLLSGTVTAIKSGLRNEPYLVLRGSSHISPQASIVQSSADYAAKLQRGNSVTLICFGDGSIIGTPRFRDCRFARDVAAEVERNFMDDVDNFFSGQPSSFSTAVNAAEAVGLAHGLPANSDCPTDYERCLAQLKKLKADEAQYMSLMRGAVQKLKANGLTFPEFATK
ncbi:tRNA_anti-like [Achromobacter sp. MFA1 R4]|nr:tRNA_anti-like [Achromobacter sp. MFA1 R4]